LAKQQKNGHRKTHLCKLEMKSGSSSRRISP
jgi:hypothetical protein